MNVGTAWPRFRWQHQAALIELNWWGWNDTLIARELGFSDNTIAHYRKRLGLPSHYRGTFHRQALRESCTRTLRQRGYRNVVDLRLKVRADYAVSYGLPADLLPREVQILRILYARWPKGLTRRQLVERLGLRWRGSSHSLRSSRRSNSYLGELLRRGLVRYRHQTQGGKRIAGTYEITAAAYEAMAPAMTEVG